MENGCNVADIFKINFQITLSLGSTFGRATDIFGLDASDTAGGSQIYENTISFYLSHNKHTLTELWKGLYVLTTDRSVVGLYVQ